MAVQPKEGPLLGFREQKEEDDTTRAPPFCAEEPRELADLASGTGQVPIEFPDSETELFRVAGFVVCARSRFVTSPLPL